MKNKLEFKNLPLRCRKSKKKWIYSNLNVYRNANYHSLNYAKVWFLQYCLCNGIGGKLKGKIKVHYRLWIKKNSDLMNAGSIADKYFQDALVKLGVIKDDNAEIVRFVSFEFMGYDKIGWFDVTLEEI